MAIIKSVLTPFGVQATYHKLLKAEVDCVAMTIVLTVAIFATAQARDDGSQVMWHERQSIPFSDFVGDPRDMLYPLLALYGKSFLFGGVPDTTGEGFKNPTARLTLIPAATVVVQKPPKP